LAQIICPSVTKQVQTFQEIFHATGWLNCNFSIRVIHIAIVCVAKCLVSGAGKLDLQLYRCRMLSTLHGCTSCKMCDSHCNGEQVDLYMSSQLHQSVFELVW
jgi:hypothetical protein